MNSNWFSIQNGIRFVVELLKLILSLYNSLYVFTLRLVNIYIFINISKPVHDWVEKYLDSTTTMHQNVNSIITDNTNYLTNTNTIYKEYYFEGIKSSQVDVESILAMADSFLDSFSIGEISANEILNSILNSRRANVKLRSEGPIFIPANAYIHQSGIDDYVINVHDSKKYAIPENSLGYISTGSDIFVEGVSLIYYPVAYNGSIYVPQLEPVAGRDIDIFYFDYILYTPASYHNKNTGINVYSIMVIEAGSKAFNFYHRLTKAEFISFLYTYDPQGIINEIFMKTDFDVENGLTPTYPTTVVVNGTTIVVDEILQDLMSPIFDIMKECLIIEMIPVDIAAIIDAHDGVVTNMTNFYEDECNLYMHNTSSRKINLLEGYDYNIVINLYMDYFHNVDDEFERINTQNSIFKISYTANELNNPGDSMIHTKYPELEDMTNSSAYLAQNTGSNSIYDVNMCIGYTTASTDFLMEEIADANLNERVTQLFLVVKLLRERTQEIVDLVKFKAKVEVTATRNSKEKHYQSLMINSENYGPPFLRTMAEWYNTISALVNRYVTFIIEFLYSAF